MTGSCSACRRCCRRSRRRSTPGRSRSFASSSRKCCTQVICTSVSRASPRARVRRRNCLRQRSQVLRDRHAANSGRMLRKRREATRMRCTLSLSSARRTPSISVMSVCRYFSEVCAPHRQKGARRLSSALMSILCLLVMPLSLIAPVL